MKIAYIGTYLPRQCGIGTFTENLRTSVKNTKSDHSARLDDDFVVAVNDQGDVYEYPPEVSFTINQQEQQDYFDAAEYINSSGAGYCCIQHEYGIYGGNSGVYILSLIHQLKIPFLVTLHTVLKKPSYNEKAIMIEICKKAEQVVVMSSYAVQLMQQIYGVSKEKIKLVPHGVPQIKFDRVEAKEHFGLTGKLVLLTFGFLGRNKGIETVIKALPALVKKHPETLYIVAGKTHPNVLRHAGEEYREYLIKLSKELKVEQHISFVNDFVDQELLFKYLCACDIYITPYVNEAQITSGTLSYAIGTGAAVLSTPYWHATELLADDRGRLFPFKDGNALAELLVDLADHPIQLINLRQKATAYAQRITWPRVAEQYLDLFGEKPVRLEKLIGPADFIQRTQLPAFSLEHIKRLTDDTGIIQHANYAIPNRREGYCLDDNGRALLLALKTYEYNGDPYALDLMSKTLSYIEYMQNEDGSFRNFLSYDRNYLENIGSEDAFGRTIWALGYLFGASPNDAFYQMGKELFFKAAVHFEGLKSIRAIAYTVMGITFYLKSNPGDDVVTERMRNMCAIIMENYRAHRTENWHWFEVLLAYDNGILPLGLLHAAQVLNDEDITSVALESMEFLTNITFRKGYLSIVGNDRWYHRDGELSRYAQQPLDAMAMVLLFQEAYNLTKEDRYLEKLYQSFKWFLGENDLHLSLYDHETKGCCDGLEYYGINRNQGAESSLSFLLSQLAVLDVLTDDYEPDFQKDKPLTAS